MWTSSYNGSGVAGYIVYVAKSSSDKGQCVGDGKVPSSNYSLSDSHIFLPAAGDYAGRGFLLGVGRSGDYYSSSPNFQEDGSVEVFAIRFDSEGIAYMYISGPGTWRCNGQSVRAVCK